MASAVHHGGPIPARVNAPQTGHTLDCSDCDGTGRHYSERSISVDREDIHTIGVAYPIASVTTGIEIHETSRLCSACEGSGKVDPVPIGTPMSSGFDIRVPRGGMTYADYRKAMLDEDPPTPPEPDTPPGVVEVRPMEIP